MSAASKPGVGNAAGVALLVLSVANVPGLIRSVGSDTPKHTAIGYGLALAVGGASSVLGRTPWPLLGTVAMCLLMLHLQNQAGRGVPGAAG
jgi:hypothetical protein